MGLRDTVRCSRCGKDVPFPQVRLLPDGKRFGCVSCLGIVQREEKERQHREERKLDFQCASCRCRFQRSVMRPPKSCPQCGSHKLLAFESDRISSRSLLR